MHRVLASAVCVAFGIIVAAWLAPSMWSDLHIAIFSLAWPTTVGEVVEHRVSRVGGKGGSTYFGAVTFTYEASGEPHRGSQLLCEHHRDYDASKCLSKYSKGRKTIVFYDPNDPSRAVLEPHGFRLFTVTKWLFEIAFVVTFVVVIPAAIWAIGSNKRFRKGPQAGVPEVQRWTRLPPV